jgi:hypothetical protein
VTLTNGKVTSDSTLTVEGDTVAVHPPSPQWGYLGPKRITETLADLGYRTLEILPAGADSVRVLVERKLAS